MSRPSRKRPSRESSRLSRRRVRDTHALSSHRSIARRSGRHGSTPFGALRTAIAALFFASAVIACGVAVGATSSIASGQGTGGSVRNPPISKAQAMAMAWCGRAGKPACPPRQVPWVSMRSEAPADILAAAKSTSMYQSALTTSDLIGAALRSGTLAEPVLVMPYRDDVGLPEVWVIPVVNKSGIPLVMLEFEYDAPNHRIYASEFDAVTGNMFYASRPFPAQSPASAMAVLMRERHIAIRQGGAPQLIYFPQDHEGLITGRNHWTAGGTSVIDPIWRIPAADGRWYYVDHDGHSHLGSEIPVDPQFASLP